VLAVLEPLPLVAADFGLVLPPAETEVARRESLRERVAKQMREVAGEGAQWQIEIREGDPAPVIVRTARELEARAIVLGLGQHDLLDRIFGGETALQVLRLAKVPVFAVAPSYQHLPVSAVVATDFSFASVRAARAALEMFDTIRKLYLVHVAPRIELQPEAFAAWVSLYGEGVGPAFERVKAELGAAPEVVVETVVREGKPSREILDLARSVGADIVVSGSRGAGLIDRLLVGSTATGLIRGAQCSVLAVPAPGGSERRVSVPGKQHTRIPKERWAAELEAFTRRNAGRRTTLEVDDPELGAQAQEHDYPFLGAAYDRKDGRVELMLGDFGGAERHLTRNIPGVSDIEIIRDEQGRDWILRIVHGSGQTLLTLVR
jgi:nucleotide-binding universal stress UspA family protein